MADKRASKDNIPNRQKDYVTNKLLLVFTIAFAVLLLLMNVGRMMKSTNTFLTAFTMTKVIAVCALVLTAAGIVMMIVSAVRKADVKYVLLSGKNIASAALFIAICAGALSLAFNQSTLTLLYVFIPAVVVLYIIYYSYQREFFVIALASAVGATGIWLLSSGIATSKSTLIIAAVSAAIVLLAAFTIWGHVGHGTVKIAGKEFSVFKKDARFGLVYLTFVLVIALLAAAVIASDLSVYFIFGLIGYIVFAGVYYTVKLI